MLRRCCRLLGVVSEALREAEGRARSLDEALEREKADKRRLAGELAQLTEQFVLMQVGR